MTDVTLFRVYIPTDTKANLVDFKQCLSEMVAIIESSNVELVYILGYFNAHISDY